MKYLDFLKSKVAVAPKQGFDILETEVNPLLKPHQKAIVRWMVAGGRRACLMTVPYRAILKGRYGMGCELSPRYFLDGAAYCKAAEKEMSMPTLFDLMNALPEAANR